MVLDVATPSFDPVSASTVQSFLSIFTDVFNWVAGRFTTLINFMLSNPYLVIALALITISAVIGIFKAIAR